MYRPNRFTPLMPGGIQPKQPRSKKSTNLKSTESPSQPAAKQRDADESADRVLALERTTTMVYPTKTEAFLKVRHREGQDVVFVKPNARSKTLPLTWSAVNGSELDHKPVNTETLKKYMRARDYPTAEVDMVSLAHKLAEETGIRFRRHGRNPNVWFATSLRPPAGQEKPKLRPWYSIW